MDDRKERSSILKPKKPRNPLGDLDFGTEEIEVDQTIRTSRRVSFASSNFIKQFVTDPEKVTIWDTTYEEKLNKSDNTTDSQNTNLHISEQTTDAVIEAKEGNYNSLNAATLWNEEHPPTSRKLPAAIDNKLSERIENNIICKEQIVEEHEKLIDGTTVGTDENVTLFKQTHILKTSQSIIRNVNCVNLSSETVSKFKESETGAESCAIINKENDKNYCNNEKIVYFNTSTHHDNDRHVDRVSNLDSTQFGGEMDITLNISDILIDINVTDKTTQIGKPSQNDSLDVHSNLHRILPEFDVIVPSSNKETKLNKTICFNSRGLVDDMDLTKVAPLSIKDHDAQHVLPPQNCTGKPTDVDETMDFTKLIPGNLILPKNHTMKASEIGETMEFTQYIAGNLILPQNHTGKTTEETMEFAQHVAGNLTVPQNHTIKTNEVGETMEFTQHVPGKLLLPKNHTVKASEANETMEFTQHIAGNFILPQNHRDKTNEVGETMEFTQHIPGKLLLPKNHTVKASEANETTEFTQHIAGNFILPQNHSDKTNEVGETMEFTQHIPGKLLLPKNHTVKASEANETMEFTQHIAGNFILPQNHRDKTNEVGETMEFTQHVPGKLLLPKDHTVKASEANETMEFTQHIAGNFILPQNYRDKTNEVDETMEFTQHVPGKLLLPKDHTVKASEANETMEFTQHIAGNFILPQNHRDKTNEVGETMEFTQHVPGKLLLPKDHTVKASEANETMEFTQHIAGNFILPQNHRDKTNEVGETMEFTQHVPGKLLLPKDHTVEASEANETMEFTKHIAGKFILPQNHTSKTTEVGETMDFAKHASVDACSLNSIVSLLLPKNRTVKTSAASASIDFIQDAAGNLMLPQNLTGKTGIGETMEFTQHVPGKLILPKSQTLKVNETSEAHCTTSEHHSSEIKFVELSFDKKGPAIKESVSGNQTENVSFTEALPSFRSNLVSLTSCDDTQYLINYNLINKSKTVDGDYNSSFMSSNPLQSSHFPTDSFDMTLPKEDPRQTEINAISDMHIPVDYGVNEQARSCLDLNSTYNDKLANLISKNVVDDTNVIQVNDIADLETLQNITAPQNFTNISKEDITFPESAEILHQVDMPLDISMTCDTPTNCDSPTNCDYSKIIDDITREWLDEFEEDKKCFEKNFLEIKSNLEKDDLVLSAINQQIEKLNILKDIESDINSILNDFKDLTDSQSGSSECCIQDFIYTKPEEDFDISDDLQESSPTRKEIQRLHKSSKKYWNILSMNDGVYEFDTLFETLVFKVHLDENSQIVSSIETKSKISATTEPLCLYIHKIFKEKLLFEHVQSALAGKMDVLSLLDYVLMTMKNLLKRQKEFDDLTETHRVTMDEHFCIHFTVINFDLTVVWKFKFNVFDLDQVTSKTVNFFALVGQIPEGQIRNCIEECPKGFPFISVFVNNIYTLVDNLVEKQNQRKHVKT